jgi:hypothetical protein
MSSIFQEAFALASDGIDEVFGEWWVYMPMAKDSPNTRPSPDPLRNTKRVFAVYIDPFARAFSGPERKQGFKVEHPGHASDRPVCNIALCRLPYEPRDGDRVIREQTKLLYEIAERRPNGMGRAALDLNLLGNV